MTTATLLSLILATAGPEAARDEDVTYPNGELELAAQLLLPEFGGPFPAAVVIQGSGDSDRTNPWAASIARELTFMGIAVLLTDKRGCGASQGDWLRADFEELAQDALAGVTYLRGRDDIDAERIGLVGLSQGGWIAPIAAARSDRVAFVISVSGAAVSFAEQVTHEMANTARRAGLAGEDIERVLALGRAASRYALTDDWETYADLRAGALDSPARPVALGFPDGREHPRWTFLRGVGRYDPLPFWTVVDPPTLVLLGSADEQDNVPVAESVRRLEYVFDLTGKANGTIVVLDGLGHGLQEPGQSALAESFLRELGDWVDETIRP